MIRRLLRPRDETVSDPLTGLVLETSAACQLSCPFCFLRSYSERPEPALMPVAVAEAVVPYLAGLSSIDLTGWGEPLLNPELFAIIETIRGRFSGRLTMTTNGLLLTREKIERLISRRLSALCVSADASEEKTYQAVRPGGDFSRLLNVLDQLIASRQEAKCPEPLIFATFLLRRRALSELAPFARLMAERGLDGVIFQHLTGVFSKAGCEEIAYSSYYGNPFPEAELTEALAAARAAVPRGFTLVGPERIAPRRTGNCGGFDLSRAFITASGQVSVCCAMASPCAFIRRDGNLERTRAFTFGDAREKPLPEIWASKSYAQTRAAIRSGKVPPACGDCIGLYMTAGEVCRKE